MLIQRATIVTLLVGLSACDGQKVVDGAECSEAEQELFLACLDAGCSASYTQDLGASDSCAVDGGGSIITVEAGASCGFTSSGSCFVLCDCPDGVGVQVEVGQGQGGIAGEDLSAIESAVQAVEDAIGALTDEQSSSDTEVDALAERLAALETAHAAGIAEREAENAALRAELEATKEQLAEVDARTAGAVVVSEYTIHCTAGRSESGDIVLARGYETFYRDGTSNRTNCIVALIDPANRPFAILVDTVEDNTLTYAQYSRADSLVRFGEDRPDLYDWRVNWGNTLDHSWSTHLFGHNDLDSLSASGEVYLSAETLYGNSQWDNTDPENPIWTDIFIRVVIIHDRPYSAPPLP